MVLSDHPRTGKVDKNGKLFDSKHHEVSFGMLVHAKND